jgi:transglutaminase-like putative cysteine protease
MRSPTSGAEDLSTYLAPTYFIDSDHPDVAAYAGRAVGDAAGDVDRAVRLFYTIRDGLLYDPYTVTADRDAYRASAVLRRTRAFCVPKAILMAAAARSLGIPARLGFADVKNHLSSEKLRARMGTDLFVFHGYAELHLGGRWVKATPAFNLALCERLGTVPLEFDGESDALLQPFDRSGRRHMEYVHDRGTFAEFPFEEMIQAFAATYGGWSSDARSEHDEVFHGKGK